ncbi:MAG TPA: hypothetical protein VNT22_11725 [Baekduia sp.]|nr:hypothetical protein [Baekduia sp.]
MTARKKMLAAVMAGGALVFPTVALADVFSVGVDPAGLAPACPADCVVLAKVTGYQAKSGTTKGPMIVPQSGRIVAWSITLGKPTAEQRKFFEEDSGLGEATANFTVLRAKKKLMSSVVQQGPTVKLTKYFGKTVQFPLTRTISVKKGQVIALTTPSWVPVMAVKQPNSTSWRASRGKGKCEDTTGKDYSQTTIGTTVQYRCLYRGVQLLYGVTIVSNPTAAAP